MIVGLNGQPGIALIDPHAGILEKDDGSRVLVFIDPPSGVQFHIPMTDEQEQALHAQWTGRGGLVVAGADEMPPATNGHQGG